MYPNSNKQGFSKSAALFTFLAGISSLHSQDSRAADLKAPFDLETANTLPKGVRNPRFKNVFMSVDGKFDSTGTELPLGNKLNKVVSWQDLKDAQASNEDKAKIDAARSSAGISGDSPGSTSGQVNTYANVKVPVLGMGITETWTMAVAVPILSVDVAATSGFVANSDGQKFVDQSAAGAGPFKAEEATAKLNNAVNEKLKRLGYKEGVVNKTVSGIGDVRLVSKVKMYNDEDQTITLRNDLVLPTGKKPDADKAIDVPLGDGQWDLGATGIYDRKLWDRHTVWDSYLGYTFQSPDTLDRRLPTSDTDALSADKELVHRKLGDIINAGTSLSHTFASVGIVTGVGYGFQYMLKTKYEDGANANKYRYRLLENEMPDQLLHSGTATVGFSTIEWFKQGRFKVPFQALMSFSHPFAGRNVTTNNVVSADLVLFF